MYYFFISAPFSESYAGKWRKKFGKKIEGAVKATIKGKSVSKALEEVDQKFSKGKPGMEVGASADGGAVVEARPLLFPNLQLVCEALAEEDPDLKVQGLV